MSFDVVRQDLFVILPFLIVSFGSLLILVIDVFMKKWWPSCYTSIIVLLTALMSAVKVAPLYQEREVAFSGTLFIDPFTSFVSALIIAGAILCMLVGKDYLEAEGVEREGEYSSLYLMATAGALLLVSAAELITLFIGLEILSMALYALCGSALLRRSSAESALKYFFLGSFSSAFLLFGMALLYGLTGSFELSVISLKLVNVSGDILALSVGLILIGVLFKIGAAPLHFWTPDVYQGAPTPVTIFMASVVKIAAVCFGLRVLWLSFGSDQLYTFWSYAVWVAALLTMIIGNAAALRQTSVKRMLAYSSIAHVGYILMGFLASPEDGGGAAILFYLVAYTVMTLGSFGIVLAVAADNSNEADSDDLVRFRQLGSRRPWLAALMSLFLLSLAGLPPGMAGLLGKVYIFSAVVRADFVGLAIVGVLCSAVSCYYYLRVIVAMYFMPAEESTSDEAPVRVEVPLAGTLAVCAILTVMLGVQPSYLYDAVATMFWF